MTAALCSRMPPKCCQESRCWRIITYCTYPRSASTLTQRIPEQLNHSAFDSFGGSDVLVAAVVASNADRGDGVRAFFVVSALLSICFQGKQQTRQPPRAPGAAFQQPLQKYLRGQSSSNQHKRATSTGEFSFLSALMELSDLEDQRDRAVAWDEYFLDVSPAAEDELASLGMLQQPILMEEPPRSIHISPSVV
jgi:hypothetical protein